MNILFLGTSAGWPLPRLGCQCEICQSKNSKDSRLRPSVIINESILIDAPPDIYHQIKNLKLKIKKLKALLLTHAHLDHILGFYDLTHIYNRQIKNPLLITTQNVLNDFRQIYHFPLNPFKIKILTPQETLEIDGLKITLYPVPHGHTPTFAVKIKEQKILVYIPDLARLPKNQRKEFRGVHLLILDGSSLNQKGHTQNHETILEGIRLAKDLKPKLCYFTHIGHITKTHLQLENFVQKENKNFHIAYDGLKLEI